MGNGETYRTDDLALAVALANAEFRYELEMMTAHTALWCFEISEERSDEFDQIIADYDAFEAKVEPRKFVARWAEMRSELFDLIPPPARQNARRRSAPAA